MANLFWGEIVSQVQDLIEVDTVFLVYQIESSS